jgi:hypothetical protein
MIALMESRLLIGSEKKKGLLRELVILFSPEGGADLHITLLVKSNWRRIRCFEELRRIS